MQRLGKYEIVGVIGEGGMGTVYHARDTVIGRDVAIKVIQERALNVPEVRERFLREAQAAGRLAHENVMVIHDVGEQDGLPFIVMEYLGGTDLRKWLDAKQKLSLDEKLFIAIQICAGLQYAHEHRVVHRDVKPDNIRILRGNRVKIMDFGIARLNADLQTLTNTSIGTPRYMSPEQIKGARVDQRSDIFSFGVLFYEMLTGANPFWGEHVTTVIYKILNEEPQPIHVDDARLETDLQAIVTRCLAKSVDDRYQSMAPVVDDLRAAVAKRQGTQSLSLKATGDETRVLLPVEEVVPPPAHATPQRSGFRVPRPVLITLGAIGVVVLLLVVLLPDRQPAEGLATVPEEQSAVAGEAERASLDLLRQDALLQQQRMEEERERARAASVPSGIGTPFAEAAALEELGAAALARNDSESLREARQTFERAAALYSDAAIAAAGSDVAALRGQAEQARQAMQRAFARIDAFKDEPLHARAVQAANLAREAGERAMASETYPDAVRAYREAESGYVSVSRVHERQMALRRDADQARTEMQRSMTSVAEARASGAQAREFQEADAARNRGESQFASGSYEEAARAFRTARDAFARIGEAYAEAGQSALAARKGEAERAREVMLAAIGGVPEVHRTLDDYRRAEGIQAAGAEAFASGAFDQAQARFQEAAALFAELSRRPTGPSPEALAEQAVTRLVQRVKTAFENKDLGALQAMSPTFSSWRDFFAVAAGITANVNSSGLRVEGDRSTMTMQIQLDYLDNKNRRQSTPTLRQNWTLEFAGDSWRVAEVVPQ